jgi:hypothetical protein
MEQSHLEANSFSPSQKIRNIVWNSEVYEGLPKNSGNLTIKKCLPCLLVSTVPFEIVPQNSGDLNQPGDYFEGDWKIGVTVKIFMVKFPEFSGRPSYSAFTKSCHTSFS